MISDFLWSTKGKVIVLFLLSVIGLHIAPNELPDIYIYPAIWLANVVGIGFFTISGYFLLIALVEIRKAKDKPLAIVFVGFMLIILGLSFDLMGLIYE